MKRLIFHFSAIVAAWVLLVGGITLFYEPRTMSACRLILDDYEKNLGKIIVQHRHEAYRQGVKFVVDNYGDGGSCHE